MAERRCLEHVRPHRPSGHSGSAPETPRHADGLVTRCPGGSRGAISERIGESVGAAPRPALERHQRRRLARGSPAAVDCRLRPVSVPVKKIFNLTLGVVTSIGGFVEVGSISTSAQAGTEFGFALLWAIAVAALILAMLAEMAGRVAILSNRSIAAAVRERFGIHLQMIPLGAELIIDLLLLAAELGGAAIAVKLLTGVGFQWWILPVGVVVWLVLWMGSFTIIEDGVGLLGIITLAFVVSVWHLHPDVRTVASGFVPSVPDHDVTRYAFLAVSIVGATISPYLLNFYASGSIEEELTESDLWINRLTAFLGMGFGSIVAMGALVTAAIVLGPRHIQVDSYEQAALMFFPLFGSWAVTLFALAIGVGCLGAA